jgi:hypothetical protein
LHSDFALWCIFSENPRKYLAKTHFETALPNRMERLKSRVAPFPGTEAAQTKKNALELISMTAKPNLFFKVLQLFQLFLGGESTPIKLLAAITISTDKLECFATVGHFNPSLMFASKCEATHSDIPSRQARSPKQKHLAMVVIIEIRLE